MLKQVNIKATIGLSRAPEEISSTVSHYIGEAHGTRIRTHAWGRIRQWFFDNREKADVCVIAMCEEEQTSTH